MQLTKKSYILYKILTSWRKHEMRHLQISDFALFVYNVHRTQIKFPATHLSFTVVYLSSYKQVEENAGHIV